ncbi:PaaI family thioesterase [Aspergillus glaucus CBS 516.65]|uniref:Thioesterase domain-containing protein n=1 Tax=Aspergillus glaucus CBS 516.65 TaxID=1160497 RepID=A0A1L9VQF2_ASPGL|nr:hypothetical protein ASPGLDRAFT_1324908 [Aspergillus glaucus CBS 516.65]OJJ86137.1 hypothetical protein ASPGLDRAFT_1324908 [Aspergillus glaucus CBS 516.65]
MSWLTRTTSSLPKRPSSILRPLTITRQTLPQLHHQQRTYKITTPRPVHPSSSPSAQQSTTVLHDDHLTNPNFPAPTSTKNEQTHIDALISTLPLVQSLRHNPSYKESRPHHSMDPSLRSMHFVAGSLAGKNKVTVAPFMWMSNPSSPPSTSSTVSSPSAKTNTKTNGKGTAGSHLYSIFHIGGHLCGHPGYVHGGLLSVMFDEAFARCVSTSFNSGLGMTANLNVDFRKPALPGRLYVLEAGTVRVEGRKAWVEGKLVCLPDVGNGEEGEGVMVAEARALFVEPKFAESMIPLYKG